MTIYMYGVINEQLGKHLRDSNFVFAHVGNIIIILFCGIQFRVS